MVIEQDLETVMFSCAAWFISLSDGPIDIVVPYTSDNPFTPYLTQATIYGRRLYFEGEILW